MAELTVKNIDGEMVTAEEIIGKYQKLVYSMAQKYKKKASVLLTEFEDLVSEGTIGLLKAYERFDSSKGIKFMTYAFPVVKGEIQRFLRDLNPGIKFPRSIKDLYVKTRDCQTAEEIAEMCEISLKKANQVLDYRKNVKSASLDEVVSKDSDKDVTILDQLGTDADYSEIHVEEFMNYLENAAPTVYSALTKRLEDKTQLEIAKELGSTQAHVSRLLKQAQDHYTSFMNGEVDMKAPKIDKARYEALKEQGLSDKAICTQEGLSVQTLINYKKKWGGISEPKPKILREKEVIKKIESSQKEAKLEKEKSELHAAADDLEQELSLIKSELLVYKKRYEESQLEIGDWREKAHSYARDNELMNETNKELRFLMEKYREENKALRTVAKLVL